MAGKELPQPVRNRGKCFWPTEQTRKAIARLLEGGTHAAS
jgi:hypothetical protein